MDYQKELTYICQTIKEYFSSLPTTKAFLGISGGADSTIVAMLLTKTIGANNVYGLLMPNGEQADIEDSIFISEALKINYQIKNIEKMYQAAIADEDFSDKTKTNIAPRLRMTKVYSHAQENGGIVVGTGNGSERYVGWCTKHADTASDGLTPLLPYTKVEVVEIGKLLLKELFDENSDTYKKMYAMVVKAPADGLTSKTDEDNLGFTYQQLHDYQRKGSSGSKEIDQKIETMHAQSEHKRSATSVPNRALTI